MAVSVAVGLLIGGMLNPAPSEEQYSYGNARHQKIQDIMHLIDQRYVDSVDVEDLFEQTISAMLHRLDPHSNYIPADELKALNESIDGQFGGVGIRFFIIRDTVCVTNVLPGSPSERAGLKSGDKIISVNGKAIAGKKISNDDVMAMLKGQEGTEVKLKLWRDGKYLTKSVVRGAIPVSSVTGYMIRKDVGFIKIDQFSRNTAIEFRSIAAKLKSQGMKKLILDLRSNPGGILTSATQIADEFLKANVPIVETRGKHEKKRTYMSKGTGILKDIKLAVLINSHSASAAEILAGAIQDNDRGIIVGRRSFGKGLVQEDVLLRDGSNVRLTIARYYTPSGRCIQKPYSEDYEEYMGDAQERYDNGELYRIDSSLMVDSLKYRTPKGKIVYGGGGIMPDVFVPYDSTGSSWYLTRLSMTPAFTTFAFDYVQGKRTKWSSAEVLAKQFTVSESMLADFVKFAEKEHGVAPELGELKHSKAVIKELIKAEIARQLWVEEGFFRVRNEDDNEVQQALRLLK